MQHTKHRFSDRGDHRGDLRPYFFQRDTSDMLEEAFHELLRARGDRTGASAKAAPSTETDERNIRREQYETLFADDATMRTLFNHDLDAFCAAMEDPALMETKFLERLKGLELQEPVEDAPPSNEGTWDVGRSPARQWEEQHDANAIDDASDVPELQEDSLYELASLWACACQRWSREVLDQRDVPRDRDCYRVGINVLLIPAKIAFGFRGSCSEDVLELQVAAVGYWQASAFCMRVLDSLASCFGKKLGDRDVVHDLLDDGREVFDGIQEKLAEIEEDIRYHGKRP
ncbi:MAG: hypothetical protein Q7S96_01910 [bacterium]|nr:hypothetical protein [bacterium]